MLRSACSCFGVSIDIAEHLIILEWTKLVGHQLLGVYL